jgi:hypothetical protein
LEFAPQQETAPTDDTTHVKPFPAANSTASETPEGLTGVSRAVVVPSPSCPVALPPQHQAFPWDVSAQVWVAPALILIAVVRFCTGPGTGREVVIPSPSSPPLPL